MAHNIKCLLAHNLKISTPDQLPVKKSFALFAEYEAKSPENNVLIFRVIGVLK